MHHFYPGCCAPAPVFVHHPVIVHHPVVAHQPVVIHQPVIVHQVAPAPDPNKHARRRNRRAVRALAGL